MKKSATTARIELAGYLARAQQLTIENPEVPRNGAPLMLLAKFVICYFIYIVKNFSVMHHLSKATMSFFTLDRARGSCRISKVAIDGVVGDLRLKVCAKCLK